MALKFSFDNEVLRLDYLDNRGDYRIADYLDSLLEDNTSGSLRFAAENFQTTPVNKERINHYLQKIKNPLTNLVELKNYIANDANLLQPDKNYLNRNLWLQSQLKPKQWEMSIGKSLGSVSKDTWAALDAGILLMETKNLTDAAKKAVEAAKASKPAQDLATKTLQKLGTKSSIFLKFLKPMGILAFATIFMQRRELYKYATMIAEGKFEEIWSDPSERADFIEVMSNAISAFTMLFPFLAPVTSILFAISSGISLGKYAYEKYKELSGEKEKEEQEKKFVNFENYSFGNLLANSEVAVRYTYKKYIVPYLDKTIVENKPIRVIDMANLPGPKNDTLVKDIFANPNNPENRLVADQYNRLLAEIAKELNKGLKPKPQAPNLAPRYNKPLGLV